MAATVSKVNEDISAFGVVRISGSADRVHLQDEVISPVATHALEEILRKATPSGSDSISFDDGVGILVVTNSQQTQIQRILIGNIQDGHLIVRSQVNTNTAENPSGSLQVLPGQGIKIPLIDGRNTVPNDSGLHIIRSLLSSPTLVQASPPSRVNLIDTLGALSPGRHSIATETPLNGRGVGLA